jgi:hypothetical protein
MKDCDNLSEFDRFREKIKQKRKSKSSSKKPSRRSDRALVNYDAFSSDSEGEIELDDSSESSSESEEEAHMAQIDLETDAIFAKGTPSNLNKKWIADTAATSHMTGDRELFAKFRSITTKRMVRTGSGRLSIAGIGQVKINDPRNSKVTLKNVLYVPGLGVNLLSARALCQRGLKGEFNFNNLVIKKGDQILISATIDNGLYVVNWVAQGLEEYAFSSQEIMKLLDDKDKQEEDVEVYRPHQGRRGL